MAWIVAGSLLVDDSAVVPRVCRDPDDDDHVALGLREQAAIVTGDADLQVLATRGVDVLPDRDIARRILADL